jgi:hypothetical protein
MKTSRFVAKFQRVHYPSGISGLGSIMVPVALSRVMGCFVSAPARREVNVRRTMHQTRTIKRETIGRFEHAHLNSGDIVLMVADGHVIVS